jgi:orotidine-5'-phosphate decarboxylase
MRELMPATPFLLPGVGAQGGDVAALAPAFAPGRAAGLVTASRSIAQAHETGTKDPATAARAEAERLRETAWALA